MLKKHEKLNTGMKNACSFEGRWKKPVCVDDLKEGSRTEAAVRLLISAGGGTIKELWDYAAAHGINMLTMQAPTDLSDTLTDAHARHKFVRREPSNAPGRYKWRYYYAEQSK